MWRADEGLSYTLRAPINYQVPEPDATDSNQHAARPPSGRVLALDLGLKRIGVAISDERRLTARPLPTIVRSNWKQLLCDIEQLCTRFDVQTIVIGLPLRLDGTEGDAADGARRIARNFSLSLPLTVHLQDERLTSREAEQMLRARGLNAGQLRERVDGQAATLILLDYLGQQPTPPPPPSRR